MLIELSLFLNSFSGRVEQGGASTAREFVIGCLSRSSVSDWHSSACRWAGIAEKAHLQVQCRSAARAQERRGASTLEAKKRQTNKQTDKTFIARSSSQLCHNGASSLASLIQS